MPHPSNSTKPLADKLFFGTPSTAAKFLTSLFQGYSAELEKTPRRPAGPKAPPTVLPGAPGASAAINLVKGLAGSREDLLLNLAQGADPSLGLGAAKTFGRPSEDNILPQLIAGALSPGFGEFKAAGKGLKAILKHFREFPEASLSILRSQYGDVASEIRGASPKDLNDLINVLESREINRLPGVRPHPTETAMLREARMETTVRRVNRLKQDDIPNEGVDIELEPPMPDEDLINPKLPNDPPETLVDKLRSEGVEVKPIDDLIAFLGKDPIWEVAPESPLGKLLNTDNLKDLNTGIAHHNSFIRDGFYRMETSVWNELSRFPDKLTDLLKNSDAGDIDAFFDSILDTISDGNYDPEDLESLKKLLDHVDNANIDLTDEAYSALEDGLGATKEALLPNADDFLPEGMTLENYRELRRIYPNADDDVLFEIWEEIEAAIDPETTLGMGLFDEQGNLVEDLINPKIPDDLQGGLDEIVGGANPPSLKGIFGFDDEYLSIADFTSAALKDASGNVPYEKLADDAATTQRLMQDASVDDIRDFIDLVFDDLETLEDTGAVIPTGGDKRGMAKEIDRLFKRGTRSESLEGAGQRLGAPLEHTLMVALVKEELAAKAVLGDAAVGGMAESRRAFDVFNDVLFPEIPEQTLSANMRRIFEQAKNETEALKFMWNTARGR